MTAGAVDANSVLIRAAGEAPLAAFTPLGATLLAEIGLGDPTFATAYAARSPQTRLIRIDLGRDPVSDAERAAALFADLDRLTAGQRPDVVVFSDGLQLFDDPHDMLVALRARCAPGCVALAAAANATHWSILAAQLEGRWIPPSGDEGPVRRLFARRTLIEALRDAGWTPVDVAPVVEGTPNAAAVEALEAAARTLDIRTPNARIDLSASAWVARACNGPAPAPVTVAALGMKKIAGVTEARVDHPLAALGSLASMRTVWGAGGVDIPGQWPPGVLILQRQFMDGSAFVDAIESRIARGWLVVSEIDDDPAHWREFAAADHRAFRGVHAVSVSTEALADVIRPMNPNLAIFPNAAPYLPAASASTPKSGERLRVFFGALNRGADWQAIAPRIAGLAAQTDGPFEFTVVHDQEFFDALGPAPKRFLPTLGYDAYMAALAECDIALLPLNDTPFNRLKSDIKLIECAAAGVVPICSPTLYADEPVHGEFALFATTPDDWAAALLSLASDPAALAQRRRIGLDYVASRRMQVHQIARREAVFRDWIARRPELEAARRQRLADRAVGA